MLSQKTLEERRKGIGGSDSAAIMGFSRWKTPYDIWLDKTGMSEPEPVNNDMRRGEVCEPIAASVFAQRQQRKVRRHPDMQWLDDLFFGNIDRHIVDNGDGRGPGVLEIKCPRFTSFLKIKREGLPEEHQIQLQHYLMVKKWAWGAFAVFCADSWELISFDIDADPELHEMIRHAGRNFWMCVVNNIPPVDDEDKKPEVKLPNIGGELVKVDSNEWKQRLEALAEARQIKEDAEALYLDECEKVKYLMGDTTAIEYDGIARVHYSWNKPRKSLDTKALKKAHPEIDFSKFEKVGQPSRSLRPYFF